MDKKRFLTVVVAVFAVIIGVQVFYLYGINENIKLIKERSMDTSSRQKGQKNIPVLSGGSNPSSGEWDPYRELDQARKDINRVFDNMLSQGGHGFRVKESNAGGKVTANMDFTETDSQYIVKVAVPGMEEQDIDVEIKNKTLIMSGLRKNETEESRKGQYHKEERSQESFSRAIRLPEDIAPQKMITEYKKDVLTVKIPKTESS